MTDDARTRLREECQVFFDKHPNEATYKLSHEAFAALLAPPPAVDGCQHEAWNQMHGYRKCADCDAMLAAAPTPPAASPPAPSALVEACEPFKHVAEPIIHNDRDRWNPDEWSKRLNNLTVGHFRDLHAALAHHSAQPASEGEASK